MVGVVLVSHSAMLAEGVAELIAPLQPDLPVRAAGGTSDGRLGTSADRIHRAIVELDNPDGVLILLDLGSAIMSAEIALEWLSDEQRARVLISDAPLVEGAVLVATSAALGLPLEELAACAQEARHFPKDLAPVGSGRG
jgi:dihydroxyacetone kinase phosphotransfer subunit